MTQERARGLMDKYVQSLPLTDIRERQYKGYVTLRPMAAYVENLHIIASSAEWQKTSYTDTTLNITRIQFNPNLLLWKGVQEIKFINGIEFQAKLSFEELSQILALNNPNLTEFNLWFDGGHIFIQGFFELLKSKFEFDGTLILTPSGELKYHVLDIINEEGELVRSKQVYAMLNENLNFTIPIRIMDQSIKLDRIEILEDGVKFEGKSEKPNDDDLVQQD